MRIAVVTQPYYPRAGGISEHAHHTAVELRRLGHEVDVITSRFRADGGSGPGVHRLGRNLLVPHFGGFSNVCAGWNLSRDLDRIFRTRDFDVIHVHQPLTPTLPLTAISRAPAEAVVVGTFHAAGPHSLGYQLWRPVLQRFADRLDARVAVSHAARRFAGQYFPGDYDLVPNGVDPDRFHPRNGPLPAHDPSRPTLLFVGRFYRRKGLPILLAAMRRVRDRIPAARLLVVGDGPHAPEYRHLARPLGDAVQFLGELSVDDLPRAYRSADVFVAPSTDRESFGVIHLEAMASATPIIASDIEGYRELLDPGREALLFPNRDVAALADTIVRVLEDERLRRSMASAGRAKAERYAWSGIAHRLETLYYDRIERRAPAARIRLAS